MKKLLPKITAAVLAAFGLLTLFLSSSLIFDLFDMRARQGNYVLIVVWANFICSFFYLFAAYGFAMAKKWTTKLLGAAVIVLVAASIGFVFHVHAGGLFETRTIGALAFRIVITSIFAVLAHFMFSKRH